MKVLVTGASGLVGGVLVEKLILKEGLEIHLLTRDKKKLVNKYPSSVKVFNWNIHEGYLEKGALDGVDCVFHLAGENVADGRWSKSRKKKILESRILGTQFLLDEISKCQSKPRSFISSSAIGIYGDAGDRELKEEDVSHENSFLVDVVKKWESKVLNSPIDGMRKVCLRTGIVLSSKGGAMKKMLPPFKMGIGGNLGDGKQFMSWIHVDDLVNIFIFALEHENVDGAINAVAPNPVTNAEFTKTLGRVLNRPTIIPIPKLAIQTLFGEMGSILLDSQKVSSQKIENLGYSFKYSQLEKALMNL